MGIKRGSYVEMVMPLQCGHALICRTLISEMPKNWAPKTFEMMADWADDQTGRHRCHLVDEEENPNGLIEIN
jgi:hypothetical protein